MDAHAILEIIWFLLIAVLILGYFILDGFDLGAGLLYPFIAKDEKEKKFVRRAIGPLWDGNEVWLLTAGGALFAAFAPAYATSFSGFYLAIMLVLFGLIFRAIALEFRGIDKKWSKFWDAAFFVGSFLPALLFGAAIGNIIEGVALAGAGDNIVLASGFTAVAGDYVGGFFSLLNPFALLCAVLGLVTFVTLGAAWIALKAPVGSAIHQRAVKARSIFNIIEILCFALVSVFFFLFVLPTFEGRDGMLFAYVFAVVLVVGWIVARLFINKGNDLLAFITGNAVPVGLVGITAASLFPNLIPAADNPEGAITYFLLPGADIVADSLTIFNSGNSELCLTAMLIITCIGLPLVLAYHVIIYRTFRGRIDMDEQIEY
ncbi:MAG: cytochrome d ubiquinol oxidase subunit II [Coriobacteriales bacterium]|jgi:cytochrome d ubiquinol oxidase subunit II|nr:cytochrome d ubiquinol oxidase subunit II [Coriobacteriales bacterium]